MICKRCGGAEFYEYRRPASRGRAERIDRRCAHCARERQRSYTKTHPNQAKHWKRGNPEKRIAQGRRYRERLRDRILNGEPTALLMRDAWRERHKRYADRDRANRPAKQVKTAEQSRIETRAKRCDGYYRNAAELRSESLAKYHREIAAFRAALDLGLIRKHQDLFGSGMSRGQRKAFRKREYRAAVRAMRDLNLVQ